MSFEFTEHDLDPTGVVECTDLTDIDRAVRNYFGHVINSMVVTDTNRDENREFAKFQERDVRDKLYIGQFDTPEEFIKELASQKKQGGDLFPACYLSRDPGIAYCAGDDYVDQSHCADLQDNQGHPYAIINKSFAKLTYSLTALTWNKETCGRLGLGITMWFRHNKKNRPRKFTAKTMIAGAPVKLHIEINQPRLVSGASVPVSFAEKRLHGVWFDFEVIAEVLEAQASNVSAKRFICNDVEVML